MLINASFTTRQFSSVILTTLIALVATSSLRKRPDDWDDEADGEWEPPTEAEAREASEGTPNRPTYRFVKKSEYKKEQQQQQQQQWQQQRQQQQQQHQQAPQEEHHELWWPGKGEWKRQQEASEEQRRHQAEQWRLQEQQWQLQAGRQKPDREHQSSKAEAERWTHGGDTEGMLFETPEQQTQQMMLFMGTLSQEQQAQLREMPESQRMLALMHKHSEYVEAGILQGHLPSREDPATHRMKQGHVNQQNHPQSNSNSRESEKAPSTSGRRLGDNYKMGGAALLKGLLKKKPKPPKATQTIRIPSSDGHPRAGLGQAPSEGAPPGRQMLDPNDRRSWHDGPDTTQMWQLIARNDLTGFRRLFNENPSVVHMRSGDGRGPLWWAHEYHRTDMIAILLEGGASRTAADINGLRAEDLSTENEL